MPKRPLNEREGNFLDWIKRASMLFYARSKGDTTDPLILSKQFEEMVQEYDPSFTAEEEMDMWTVEDYSIRA